MSIDNRAYLKIGERILLSRNKAGNDQEVYQITGRVGEGGSAICYEAVRNRNGHLETGLLKEFYPADDIENNIVYSIFRLKNGQIVPGAGTLDRFVKMRDEYMDAYNLLNDKMLESEDNRLMGNFIQIPELLYGCFDEDVESPAVYDEVDIKALSEAIDGAVPTSGYIWTRGVVGQSYGEFIKEIKRNSESNSDFKLLQVIQTVIALTEGVMSIHVAGLLHLDIKPSNFMLPYREGQIVNEHTIYLQFRPELTRFVNVNGSIEKSRHDCMYAVAIEKGVPRDVIFIENVSSNTGENIQFTKKMISDETISIDSVIVVDKPFKERRLFATLKKQWPELNFSVTSPKYSFEEYLSYYQESEELTVDDFINIMVGDLQRIDVYGDNGFQIKQEIPDTVWDAFQILVKEGYDKQLIKA